MNREGSKDERKRISLRVSRKFHRRVKVQATQEDKTLEDFCIEAIKEYIASRGTRAPDAGAVPAVRLEM